MNRTEEKLLKKRFKKNKIKNIFILFICFIFFIIMIYVADIKTSEMIMKKDGRHAVFIDIENEEDMRVDIAGKTYRFNIEPIGKAFKYAVDWSKETYNKIISALGS